MPKQQFQTGALLILFVVATVVLSAWVYQLYRTNQDLIAELSDKRAHVDQLTQKLVKRSGDRVERQQRGPALLPLRSAPGLTSNLSIPHTGKRGYNDPALYLVDTIHGGIDPQSRTLRPLSRDDINALRARIQPHTAAYIDFVASARDPLSQQVAGQLRDGLNHKNIYGRRIVLIDEPLPPGVQVCASSQGNLPAIAGSIVDTLRSRGHHIGGLLTSVLDNGLDQFVISVGPIQSSFESPLP